MGGDREGTTPEQTLVKDPHAVHCLVKETDINQKHVCRAATEEKTMWG